MANGNTGEQAKAVLSEETQRFIDLWFSDGSWALEELGGHEKTIITEILAAAGIENGDGASKWMSEEGMVQVTCNCRRR